jgi:hypothetical protein
MAACGGVAQGHHFGVRTTDGLGVAGAEDVAGGVGEDAADGRIRRRCLLSLDGELKGPINH